MEGRLHSPNVLRRWSPIGHQTQLLRQRAVADETGRRLLTQLGASSRRLGPAASQVVVRGGSRGANRGEAQTANLSGRWTVRQVASPASLRAGLAVRGFDGLGFG